MAVTSRIKMRSLFIYLLVLTTFNCLGTKTKVKRVIDGDTFETEAGEKVRLIGINAPEISDIFGKEAKQYLSRLIQNKTVDVQGDNLSNDRDRYQRLLRYVILDGIDINKKMVSDGYAFAYLKYHFSNSAPYEMAQIQAREMNKGIWGDSRNETVNKQTKMESKSWINFSQKFCLVGFLVLVILLVGLYTYFAK